MQAKKQQSGSSNGNTQSIPVDAGRTVARAQGEEAGDEGARGERREEVLTGEAINSTCSRVVPKGANGRRAEKQYIIYNGKQRLGRDARWTDGLGRMELAKYKDEQALQKTLLGGSDKREEKRGWLEMAEDDGWEVQTGHTDSWTGRHAAGQTDTQTVDRQMVDGRHEEQQRKNGQEKSKRKQANKKKEGINVRRLVVGAALRAGRMMQWYCPVLRRESCEDADRPGLDVERISARWFVVGVGGGGRSIRGQGGRQVGMLLDEQQMRGIRKSCAVRLEQAGGSVAAGQSESACKWRVAGTVRPDGGCEQLVQLQAVDPRARRAAQARDGQVWSSIGLQLQLLAASQAWGWKVAQYLEPKCFGATGTGSVLGREKGEGRPERKRDWKKSLALWVGGSTDEVQVPRLSMLRYLALQLSAWRPGGKSRGVQVPVPRRWCRQGRGAGRGVTVHHPHRRPRIRTVLVRHRVAPHTVPGLGQQRWAALSQLARESAAGCGAAQAPRACFPWLLLGNARYGLQAGYEITVTVRSAQHLHTVRSPASDKRNCNESAAAVGNCWGLLGHAAPANQRRRTPTRPAANWAAHRPLQPLISPRSQWAGRGSQIGVRSCATQRRGQERRAGAGATAGLGMRYFAREYLELQPGGYKASKAFPVSGKRARAKSGACGDCVELVGRTRLARPALLQYGMHQQAQKQRSGDVIRDGLVSGEPGSRQRREPAASLAPAHAPLRAALRAIGPCASCQQPRRAPAPQDPRQFAMDSKQQTTVVYSNRCRAGTLLVLHSFQNAPIPPPCSAARANCKSPGRTSPPCTRYLWGWRG
ncbi:hypothetical protein TRIATDRAFT_283131 [Trichoderma atroviride IMI 206040]|uniref:Uncharacterized protein n=1 Tax=Hypocrea atroviridis (strain ATCC 20476 / IMI 206040) TaxID=452589 RepID=G9NRP9_HYPAI|nr:uncharacterized protein TRIATDRAFT_283131 [Trichoderma atroviride IMI 206040]EHK46682.1 hypothetical protein TRIATDRAFT_283131 [Trichoderma atroviride IMI 206040]